MKKLIMLILFVFIILVFIVSCSPQGSGGEERGIYQRGKNTKDAGVSPFIGGSNAFILDFEQDRPRTDLYAGGVDSMDIGVVIKNQGEFNVPQDNIWVKITGIDPAEFGVSSQNLRLHPESDAFPMTLTPEGTTIEPTPTYAVVEELTLQRELIGPNQYDLLAKVCYPYETQAIGRICVRENLRTLETGVCDVNAAKPVWNSGAPIHFISLAEAVSSTDSLSFTITLQKKGNGQFWSPANTNCVFDRRNENKVEVSFDTGISGLSCNLKDEVVEGTSVRGTIDIRDGTAIVRCKQTIPADRIGDYIKDVSLTARYMVENTVAKSFIGRPSGEAGSG